MRTSTYAKMGFVLGGVLPVLGRIAWDKMSGLDPGYDYGAGLLAFPGAFIGLLIGLWWGARQDRAR